MTTKYAEPDTMRDGGLPAIAALLEQQRTRALDVVVPAGQLSAELGRLVIAGADPHIDDDGVTDVDGQYDITRSAEAQLAERLEIPLPYLRKLRTGALDLWDANVGGWLRGTTADEQYAARAADPRRFLLRTMRGEDGYGIVRAVLSDKYAAMDNLDVLLAVLAGVQEAGTDIVVDGADLTEQRMTLRIVAPGVSVLAPVLLAGYRSPFAGGGVERAGGGGGWADPGTAAALASGRRAAAAHDAGYEPGAEPILFAGFVVTNSETGHGSFSITPRLLVQVCKNGLTVTADAVRKVHVGGRLDEGVIRWSEDTTRKQLHLITAQARDAVAQYLDPAYVARVVAELEETSGTPVTDAVKTIEVVAKRFAFSEGEAASILGHFIAGGQLTAGGIMQAVSSVAQTIEDGDAAAELESRAVPAMAFAASLAN